MTDDEKKQAPEEVAARTVRGNEMHWGYGSGIQDVALENGELLFALCDAYDATGEAWIAALARRAWRGLKTIGSVSPVAGFVPRGPHPRMPPEAAAAKKFEKKTLDSKSAAKAAEGWTLLRFDLSNPDHARFAKTLGVETAPRLLLFLPGVEKPQALGERISPSALGYQLKKANRE